MNRIPHLVFSLIFAGIAHAAPSNDHFANRISGSAYSITYTITDINTATTEGGERLTSGSYPKSVWYQWTAPDDGLLRVDSTNTQYWHQLDIFYGDSLPNLKLIAQDGGTTSSAGVLEIPVSKDSVYVIRFRGESGNLAGMNGYLTVSLRTDTQFNGIPLSRPSTINNDLFANRIVLFGNLINVIGYSTEATREGGEPDGSDSRTLWYQWTAPGNGYLSASILHGDWTRLHFWTGSQIHQLTSRGYFGNRKGSSGSTNVSAGTTYMISVGGDGEAKAFSLAFSPSTLPPPSTVSDRYNPVAAITGTSPRSGARLPRSKKITIKGRAVDDLWLSRWEYSVNGRGGWNYGGSLSGTSRSFGKTVRGLTSGRNVIYLRAVDHKGKYSRTVYRYLSLKGKKRR